MHDGGSKDSSELSRLISSFGSQIVLEANRSSALHTWYLVRVTKLCCERIRLFVLWRHVSLLDSRLRKAMLTLVFA